MLIAIDVVRRWVHVPLYMPKQVPAVGESLLSRPRFADILPALAESTTQGHLGYHQTWNHVTMLSVRRYYDGQYGHSEVPLTM